MDVPTRTRDVNAASRASWTMASGLGFVDATWPPTHRESTGRASKVSTRERSGWQTKPTENSVVSAFKELLRHPYVLPAGSPADSTIVACPGSVEVTGLSN
jgi:hypothetical protein